MLSTEERQQIKAVKEWISHPRDMEKQAGDFTSKILKLTGMTQNPMTRMLDTIEWLIAIVEREGAAHV